MAATDFHSPVTETRDVKAELLRLLERETRLMVDGESPCFTTQEIARAQNVSRSLASQYLNELLRDGDVVKVGGRPVRYYHRGELERRLQTRIAKQSYPSIASLVKENGVTVRRDFKKAVGYNASLSGAIEQCKAALKYPPCGLPLLLAGPVGTGKALLSRLTFEYGRNEGVFDGTGSYIRIDCARYAHDASAFVSDMGLEPDDGMQSDKMIVSAAGGVLFLDEIGLLPVTAQEALVSYLLELGSLRDDERKRPRIIMSTSFRLDDPAVQSIVRRTPIIAHIPALRDRNIEEREELALGFLRHEGRRMGLDVYVSRGAFRILADSEFEGNVSELRSCITNCCAESYLSTKGDRLEINTYQLPPALLDRARIDRSPDDGELIDTVCGTESQNGDALVHLISSLPKEYERYCNGEIDTKELADAACRRVRDLEDYLVFERTAAPSRASAFETVLNGIVDDVSTSHGIDLSRKTAHIMAQEFGLQMWPDVQLSKWRLVNEPRIENLFAVLSMELRFAWSVADQISAEFERSLGIATDKLTALLLLMNVAMEVEDSERRQAIGIVLSHGYSTATSIADAANRMLSSRLFEAIDMPFDQQVKDVIPQVRQLVEKYSYCASIIFLVDMGSLEEIYKDLSGAVDVTMGIINNVSTGLALEVGAGILAGKSVGDILAGAAESCRWCYDVIDRASREDAIVFCSENGMDVAEHIRQLVAQSLPRDIGMRLIALPYRQLTANGADDAVMSAYSVRAIIGIGDLHIEGVPFIALEDIISADAGDVLDEVFSPHLSESDLSAFHERLFKNMTLQNVIRSITILNPEKLFDEIEHAVENLQHATGERVAGRAAIGLYVHLCCLVERLVTRNPIEDYACQETFEHGQKRFIEAFRDSFAEISAHYHVEVPTSEIAYAFDYIQTSSAPRRRERLSLEDGLFDE